MQMAEQFDISTLAWVKGEIDETLKQARIALEAFVDNPDDVSQLEFCISYIHQVYGTLQMVELLGAAMFAEEGEKFAVALRDGAISDREQAFELLMRAILQLPDYLEALLSGQADNPITLLPLLNELRALRGDKALDRSLYFRPDLETPPPARKGALPANLNSQVLAKKLYHYYLPALAKLLKTNEINGGMKAIATVVEKLYGVAEGDVLRRTLWIYSGYIESLRDGAIEFNQQSRPLFGKLEQLIKFIAANGESALKDEAVAPLLRTILLQLAESSASGRLASELRQSFNLSQLLPSTAGLGGLNAELKKTVSSDIMEELSRVKDIFDIYVRSDRSSATTLEPMVDSLSSMAETLGMLQEESLRETLKAQVKVVQQLVAGEAPAVDDTLMGIAGAILAVESALRDWGSVAPLEKADASHEQVADTENTPEAVAEHQRVTRQVMKEAKDDLVRMREAINSYLENPTDKSFLDGLPGLIHQVTGSLTILSYKRVANILDACRRFIEKELIANEAVPASEKLDALADAVMSIEYYLEAFVQSRVHPSSVLEVAERAIGALGLSMEQQPVATELEGIEVFEAPAVAEPEVAEAEPFVAAVPAEESLLVPEVVAGTESIEILAAPVVEEPQPPEVVEPPTQEAVEPPAPEAVEQVVPVTTAKPAVVRKAPVEVDEEILEIFVEEAEEELQKIGELLPRWSSNPADEESLKDLRRCFHTLKGSGRLVGATELGEFAWAFESMLNRVIDGTISHNAAIFDMLEQARETLPELVEQFKSGTAPTADVLGLQEMAFEVSQPGGIKATPSIAPAASAEPVATAPVMEIAAPLEEPSATPSVVLDLPELDPILLDIYSKESAGHLDAIAEFLHQVEDGGSRRPSEPLIRALHTLKGSSTMADIGVVAGVAASLEKYCKTLQALHESIDDAGLAALHHAHAFFADMIAFLADRSLSPPDVASAQHQADEVYQAVQHMEHVANAAPEAGLASKEEIEEVIETSGPAESIAAEVITLEQPPASIEEAAQAEEPLTAPFEGFELIEEVSAEEAIEFEPLETAYVPTAEGEDLIGQALEAVATPEEATGDEQQPAVEEAAVEQVAHEEEAAISVTPTAVSGRFDVEEEYDPELLEIFLEEAVDILDSSERTLQEWVRNPEDRALVEALQRQLHTLKGGARMAGIKPIGDLSHSLETTFDQVVDGLLQRSPQMMDLLQLSHDRLVTMLEQVRNHEPVVDGNDLISRVAALGRGEDISAAEEVPPPSAIVVEEIPEVIEAPEVAAEAAKPAVSAPFAAFEAGYTATTAALVAWQRDIGDKDLFGDLRSCITALAASSRGLGVEVIERVADAMVALVAAMTDGHVAVTDKAGDLITLALEHLRHVAGQMREGSTPDSGAFIVSTIQEIISEGVAKEEGYSSEVVVDLAKAKQKQAKAVQPDEAEAEQRRAGPRIQQEIVRVRADLLDNLVNFAGEVSIYRSRVEQQIGTFGSNLEEMDQTILRLREQLRLVEIETEAQIDSRRAEAQKQGYDDFDPLEFDRFTNMQTVSRSMAESLSDLLSIEEMLRGLTRETETLLLQQSRVNTELQESLMHTRMVPLVENAPRLRRIVRQTSAELGKRTSLHFQGADVEMDRNVVERMMAPLEHMLRNSIAHGIEDAATRQRAGKPEEGNITIALSREGSEIVVRVSDDGGGIDLEAVKRKAIERGMMKPGASLNDQEILRFILESGFSTAQTLSQIAGRGVGMDVVNSEIKQLGGVLDIDSKAGKGTIFTIRLPLTLSVSRALLVNVGDDIYAIPLLSIRGIERIVGSELSGLLATERPKIRWVGEEYELMHLTTVLGAGSGHIVADTKQPMLMTQSGEHRVAFAVDGLIGSREIVVKSLGPQLSTLPDLAGATILADGGVALIIDVPSMIRRGLAKRTVVAIEAVAEKVVEREPVVMVVDDSITVRKVTERLLKRHNMKCVTAKDGVDAIAVLEETMPDVMLLDIEMPRMDGYELATHIRNTERLRNIPIIMITSRTGEKHRQRAMDIGVDVYMGKPYTEVDLLESIESLIGKHE